MRTLETAVQPRPLDGFTLRFDLFDRLHELEYPTAVGQGTCDLEYSINQQPPVTLLTSPISHYVLQQS